MDFLRDYEIFGKSILRAFIVILSWYAIFTILCVIFFLTTDGFNNNKDVKWYDKIIDAIYYSTTTFSTIGYGDISPVKSWSKLLTAGAQFILIFITFNVVVEQNKKNIKQVFDDENKLQGIVEIMKSNNNQQIDSLDILSKEKQKWREIGKKIIINNQVNKAKDIINNVESDSRIKNRRMAQIIPVSE